jgi:type IV pilus assembly protein PilX
MSNHFLKLRARKESGAVLYTGLIFLLVLSMIVLSVLRSGTLEERMAANDRNRQVAIQAAEAVIRDAEAKLFSGIAYTSNFDSISLASGFYGALKTGCPPMWKDHATISGCPDAIDWSSSTKTLTFAANSFALEGVSSAPRYIVEIISPPTRANSTVPCSKGLAHITARGVGRDSSTAFIQTVYRYQSDRASDGC